MGGIVVNERMETGVAGLLAAGEAVGGANGANRLSGNAITEALVFGRRAGRTAAETLATSGTFWRDGDARVALDLAGANGATRGSNMAAMVAERRT